MTDDDLDASEISESIDALLADIEVEPSTDTGDPSSCPSQEDLKSESSASSIAEQILAVLRTDAQLSIGEISDQVGVSEPTVRKYIDQLEDRGVITGYSVEIDPGKLHHLTISLVRIEIDEALVEETIQALAAMETVYSLFSLQETATVMAEIRTNGFGELSEIIQDEILSINEVQKVYITVLEDRHI
jgi:Lrp/AsnC family transcriptional regulator for asnA, asnC and gidA